MKKSLLLAMSLILATSLFAQRSYLSDLTYSFRIAPYENKTSVGRSLSWYDFYQKGTEQIEGLTWYIYKKEFSEPTFFSVSIEYHTLKISYDSNDKVRAVYYSTENSKGNRIREELEGQGIAPFTTYTGNNYTLYRYEFLKDNLQYVAEIKINRLSRDEITLYTTDTWNYISKKREQAKAAKIKQQRADYLKEQTQKVDKLNSELKALYDDYLAKIQRSNDNNYSVIVLKKPSRLVMNIGIIDKCTHWDNDAETLILSQTELDKYVNTLYQQEVSRLKTETDAILQSIERQKVEYFCPLLQAELDSLYNVYNAKLKAFDLPFTLQKKTLSRDVSTLAVLQANKRNIEKEYYADFKSMRDSLEDQRVYTDYKATHPTAAIMQAKIASFGDLLQYQGNANVKKVFDYVVSTNEHLSDLWAKYSCLYPYYTTKDMLCTLLNYPEREKEWKKAYKEQQKQKKATNNSYRYFTTLISVYGGVGLAAYDSRFMFYETENNAGRRLSYSGGFDVAIGGKIPGGGAVDNVILGAGSGCHFYGYKLEDAIYPNQYGGGQYTTKELYHFSQMKSSPVIPIYAFVNPNIGGFSFLFKIGGGISLNEQIKTNFLMEVNFAGRIELSKNSAFYISPFLRLQNAQLLDVPVEYSKFDFNSMQHKPFQFGNPITFVSPIFIWGVNLTFQI